MWPYLVIQCTHNEFLIVNLFIKIRSQYKTFINDIGSENVGAQTLSSGYKAHSVYRRSSKKREKYDVKKNFVKRV